MSAALDRDMNEPLGGGIFARFFRCSGASMLRLMSSLHHRRAAAPMHAVLAKIFFECEPG